MAVFPHSLDIDGCCRDCGEHEPPEWSECTARAGEYPYLTVHEYITRRLGY